jgi:alkyldihydroxyacetonephosphate synthase
MVTMSNLINDLQSALGPEEVSDRLIDRLAYAHDTFPPVLKRAESVTQPFLPDVVVFPRSVEDVSSVARIASRRKVPLNVYGGGSGIVGGALAVRGGITLDTRQLTQPFDLDPISNLLTVGAGYNGQRLEDRLNAAGYTLGHYPQSLRSSSVGGWIAHRATGTASTRYGGIEALVAGMEVVLASGDILRLKATPRSATGPDLRQLFLGAEGTLGIVTQATLRIRPIPEARRWLVYAFPSFADGLNAIRMGVQAELRPAIVRLYDEIEASHLLENSGLMSDSCLLILACEGSREMADFESAQLDRIIISAGGVVLPPTPAEAWWEDRFNTRGLLRTMRTQGGISDALEVSASWRDLPRLYSSMRGGMEKALGLPGRAGQVYGHCSHVYPDGGNLYMIFHGFTDDDQPVNRLYEQVLEAAFAACHENGGSLSHHHGIGLGKARWMERELGSSGLGVLRSIQKAADPDRILNPGKIGDQADA